MRSDTVTQPTAGMRQKMATADVGDDVLGEDPTVRKLERKAADLLGKEEGLFLVSGTMANQVAAATFCRHGAEVIAADTSHIYNLEVAGLAALFGLQVRPLHTQRGVFDREELAAAIRPGAIQVAATGLVCLENSFDLNRGYAVSVDAIAHMSDIAHGRGVPVFLDGARIFNAAHALGQSASRICAPVDAAMFCLSKGLSCPVGSILVSSREFITQARRIRQRQGGGWRQAGLLAAAGLVALDEMIERLGEDNTHARLLASMLASGGFPISSSDVDTNIVRLEMPVEVSSDAFALEMSRRGIRVKVISETAVRMVTHKDIDEAVIPNVADAAIQSVGCLLDRGRALLETFPK